MCGVLGLLVFLGLGATWIALKAPKESDLQKRASKLATPLQIAALVVFALASVLFFLGVGMVTSGLLIVAILLAVIIVVGMVASILFRKNDLLAFVAQAASALLLPFLWAASVFPNLINGSSEIKIPGDTGIAINISNVVASGGAASNEYTLMWMTIIACVGVPILLFYHFLIYRAFRGRIQDEDLTY